MESPYIKRNSMGNNPENKGKGSVCQSDLTTSVGKGEEYA